MFCPNCGTKNEDDAAFCLNCGTSLVEAAVNVSTEQAQVPVSPEAPTIPVQESPVNMAPVSPVYKPKKPISKKMIGILAGSAVIVIAVIVFVLVGKKSADYEALATKYFAAEQSCEWDTVFKSIDIPSGEFLTQELLAKAHSEETPKEISNYSVNKQNDVYASILSGQKKVDDSISKDVYIDYRIKGDSGNKTETIEVIKLKEKSMLFFDKYKISPDNLVKSNFSITVSKGAKVSIDGIEVSSKYLKENTSNSSSSYTIAKETYVIDYLFEGNYTIKITQENMEDHEEDVTVNNNDDNYSYTSSKLNSKINSQLASAGQDAMKAMYDAAVARKDFSAVSSLFLNDTKIQTSAKSTYTSFAEQQLTAAGNGLTKITWSTVIGTASQNSSASEGMTAVTVTVKGTYNATVKSAYSTTSAERTGTITGYFYYRYQNGSWGLYDMNLSRIY